MVFADVRGMAQLRQFDRGRWHSWTQLDGAHEKENERPPPDGPASSFRDAVTDKVGLWGPIVGGVVAIGGGMALIGTLLDDKADSSAQLNTRDQSAYA